jgi:1,4-alpha-glucan branching enzyme
MKRKRITFEVSAPEARRASLVGDFNDWDSETHPMSRQRAGKWKLRILLPPGTYRYAVMVDGRTIKNGKKLKVEPRRFRASSDRLNVYFPWTQEI